jgi:hypothetical protein
LTKEKPRLLTTLTTNHQLHVHNRAEKYGFPVLKYLQSIMIKKRYCCILAQASLHFNLNKEMKVNKKKEEKVIANSTL